MSSHPRLVPAPAINFDKVKNLPNRLLFGGAAVIVIGLVVVGVFRLLIAMIDGALLW